MDLKQLEARYAEASEAYAIGEQIMTDLEFDALQEELRIAGSPLVDMVSEDFVGGLDSMTEEANFESFSIKEVRTWEQAREFFEAFPNCTFVAALKFDGICTKIIADPNKKVAQSRNRNSRNPLSFTDAINIALPHPMLFEQVALTCESFVPWEDLPILREKYDKDKYVMPRSAAISLLRTPHLHDTEDVKRLKFRFFSTSRGMGTYESELKWMKVRGLEIPKYEVFSVDLNENIEEQVLPILNRIDTGEPSDGVVIQVNERGEEFMPEIKGKYQSTQIALKLDRWGGKIYSAEVIGVTFGKAKGNKGVTIQIKPITLEDNSTIDNVNAYNIGILRRNNIKKGTIIQFIRVSNTICNLVYN